MGRPPGRPRKDRSEPLQVEEPKIDTSEGGLLVISPPEESHESHENEILDMNGTMYEPTVDSNISNDPSATPASCMLAIGRLYNDAGAVSVAISHHLGKVAGQPELFSFLQRMQNALGDFRHMVEQVEHGASEELLDAIENAFA